MCRAPFGPFRHKGTVPFFRPFGPFRHKGTVPFFRPFGPFRHKGTVPFFRLIEPFFGGQPGQGHSGRGDHVGLDQVQPPLVETAHIAMNVPHHQRRRQIDAQGGGEGPALAPAPHGHRCARTAGDGDGCGRPEPFFVAVGQEGRLQAQQHGQHAGEPDPNGCGAEQRVGAEKGTGQKRGQSPYVPSTLRAVPA